MSTGLVMAQSIHDNTTSVMLPRLTRKGDAVVNRIPVGVQLNR